MKTPQPVLPYSQASLPTTKQKSLKNQKMNKSYNCRYCDKKFQQKVSQNRHEGQCLKRKKSSKWRENSNERVDQNSSIEEENTKGQLISEWNFGVFKSPKKPTKF